MASSTSRELSHRCVGDAAPYDINLNTVVGATIGRPSRIDEYPIESLRHFLTEMPPPFRQGRLVRFINPLGR